MRVVSLLPAATEIVAALGCENLLVGRSHECDYPPSVQALPVCSLPLIADGNSREIDQAVRTRAEQGLSLYAVDMDQLERLQPDLILTQDQCEVCAVSLREVESALAARLPRAPRVVSLKPQNLDDVLQDVATIGSALDQAERGRQLSGELRERLGARTVTSLIPHELVCLEWLDPLMACGYWTPQLVRIVGGSDPLGKSGGHAPGIDFEALRRADPQSILAIPCGFALERAERELRQVAGEEWKQLRAVRENQLFVADGNAYFNRPGPRLVESAGILAEILWGEAEAGEGWKRVRL